MYKILIASVVILVIAVGGLGKMAYDQSKAYDALSQSFETFKEETTKSLKAMKAVEDFRAGERAKQEKSQAKLRKDAKRSNVVAAKPKLVENKINESFNKLSAEFTKETK